jgi:hypothetical protein
MLDDRTAAYVVAAHPVFEDLRQVASQLAGLLVLAATGSKDSTPDHPMLLASTQALAQAGDGVKRIRAVVSERARPHCQGLVDANVSLNAALTRAKAWPLDVDAVLVPLRDAYTHLQSASRALPGFPVVDFDQGCCAVRLKADTTA